MKKLVLDIESKKSFDEVGGAHNKHLLGVSVVGVYHYEGDRFEAYREEDFAELEVALKEAEQIIGFNLIGFDWPVLAAELGDWVRDLPTLDIMYEVQRVLGHRVSLNSIAKATLGTTKLGSGLDALVYYADGDWEKLERYCLEDVKLTRDIYEYAKKEHTLYYSKGKQNAPISITFSESPHAALFKEAAKIKGSIKMTYASSKDTKERMIDVHSFDGMYIKGFCHIKKMVLTFRIDRVEAAETVASSQPLF